MATDDLQRSLHRFVTLDQVTCVVAVMVILAVHVWLREDSYLVLLAGVVASIAAVLGLARRALAAGDLQGAVAWVAVANWAVALAAPANATFCLPITVVAAMLPSILAVPYVDARSLSRINAISMFVSMGAVVLGTMQDFSGLTGRLQPWIPPAVLVLFVPFITGLVVMVNAHNRARLRGALIEALDVNQRLRASERDLRESRARLVAATDRERRRISRDLHDGAQQRLIAMTLTVHRARRLVRDDPASATAMLERLAGELRQSMTELRNLAHGVYPAVLTDRGLTDALTELATRAPCHCLLEIGTVPRFSPEVESSVYWCCVEALQNVAKHAGPGARARLRVTAGERDSLVFVVEDDGRGFDPATAEFGRGVSNMTDRIGAVGGELTVTSLPGRGVRVLGVVPVRPPQVADVRPSGIEPSSEPRRGGRLYGGASVAYTYDLNGNQTSGGGLGLAYNAKNQTSSFSPTGTAALSASYADADQTERINLGATTFASSPLGVARETRGTSSTYDIRDNKGALVAERLPSGSRYYYLFDGLGSVAGLVDTAGSDRNYYAYAPFGTVVVSRDGVANPWRFVSGYLDAFTQLTKFGTRYYDSRLGRWTQRDPVAGSIAIPRTVNGYVYVGDDPVNYLTQVAGTSLRISS